MTNGPLGAHSSLSIQTVCMSKKGCDDVMDFSISTTCAILYRNSFPSDCFRGYKVKVTRFFPFAYYYKSLSSLFLLQFQSNFGLLCLNGKRGRGISFLAGVAGKETLEPAVDHGLGRVVRLA